MRGRAVLGKSSVGAGLAVAALILVGAGYLWEVLTLSGIPVARDMQMFFIPQKHLLWTALHEGRVPLWTQFIGTGSPFLANVQSGVFYPPHWLYAILPFYLAFNLLVVLHFVGGGIFAYLLVRRLGARREAAYLAAATWMLGGYFASLLNLVNALQAAAWAPALSWAVSRTIEGRSHRPVAVLVAVTICALLAGEPQTFVFSVAAAGLIAIISLARRGTGPDGWLSLGGRLGVAAAIVAGLAMVQLLPTLELLRESGRTGGLTYGEAAAFDLQPVRLIHLLIPPDYRDPEYAFGVRSVIGRGDPWLFSIYPGALWPIFAFYAWRLRERRLEVAAWSVIAVAATVIALGENTPVYPWLFDHVPGFAAFRFPEKYMFGTAFAGMLLVGWGAEAMFAGRVRRADAWWGGAWLAVAAASLAAFRLAPEAVERFAAGFGNDRMMSDFAFAYGVWSGHLVKWVVLLALALALIWMFRRGTVTKPVFAVLLATLATADLVVAHRGLNPVVDREFYEERPILYERIPLEEIQRDYRLRVSRFDSIAGTVPVIRGVPLEAQKWLWQQISAPNVGQLWGVLQQDAWDAIKLSGIRDEQQLQRAIPDAPRRWALLRLHSVRYAHTILAVDPTGEASRIPLDTLPGTLYELERPLPRAYVVSNVERHAGPVEVINRVLSADFDLHDAVALIDSTALDAGRGDSGGVRDDPGTAPEDRSGEIPDGAGATIVHAEEEEVRVSLERVPQDGGYLVLTDSFYPGWTATVDGESRPIERANLFFRAVEVRPGDANVVFSYRSASYERGRWIAGVTLTLALLLLAGLEVRTRLRPSRVAPRS